MMKKTLLFWSAAAVCLLLSACSKDETAAPAGPQPEPEPKPEVKTERLYLSDETTEAEANPSSRAYFADGYKIAWEEGDQVAINPGDTYDVKKDAEGRWYVELPSADSYTVYYPASLCGTIDKGLFVSKIPSTQTYHKGTFDPAALPARAVASRGEKLIFKYMCSVMKLTLTGTGTEQVKQIELTTKDTGSERLSSVGEIQTGSDGTAFLSSMPGSLVNYSSRYVTLNTDNVALTAEGVDFYLTLFPTTFSQGFTVTVTLADGRVTTCTGGKGQTAARGRILAMPAFRIEPVSTTAPVSYSTDNLNWMPWEYASGSTPAALPYPQTGEHILYFKDNDAATGAKGLTLAHLQYLHDTFLLNGNSKDTFNVKAVAPIGFDCSRATYESTTLPENIFTRQGEETNKFSTDLRYVSLPKNIAVIPPYAFANNQVLRKVILPASVTEIGTYAFDLARGFVNTADGADPQTQGVYCYAATPPVLGSGVFSYTNPNFHVPAASLAAYEEAWTKYASSAQTARATLVGDL